MEKKAQCFDRGHLWFVIGITYLIGDIRLVRVIPIRILISCFVCCFQNNVWKLLLFRGSKWSPNGFVLRRIFLEITTALWFEFRKRSLCGVSETSFQEFCWEKIKAFSFLKCLRCLGIGEGFSSLSSGDVFHCFWMLTIRLASS